MQDRLEAERKGAGSHRAEGLPADQATTHALDFPAPARDPLQPLRRIFITLWLGFFYYCQQLFMALI